MSKGSRDRTSDHSAFWDSPYWKDEEKDNEYLTQLCGGCPKYPCEQTSTCEIMKEETQHGKL